MFAVASARSLHSIESKRASLATAPPPPPPVYDDECCHNNPCCKHPQLKNTSKNKQESRQFATRVASSAHRKVIDVEKDGDPSEGKRKRARERRKMERFVFLHEFLKEIKMGNLCNIPNVNWRNASYE
ncbi:hypothetical protein LguiA_024503 [Lonicera macranthoides]